MCEGVESSVSRAGNGRLKVTAPPTLARRKNGTKEWERSRGCRRPREPLWGLLAGPGRWEGGERGACSVRTVPRVPVRVCIHLKARIMLYKHRELAVPRGQGGDEGSETEGWCDMPLETVGTHVAPRA